MLNLRIVKLGGNAIERPEWLDACARAIAATRGATVVVHGGGKAVTDMSRRLGLPVEKRDGLRVTSREVAAVVEMVLAGPINRSVVAALRNAGVDALGLAGVDGGLLTAQRLSGDLGEVGRITSVRVQLLENLVRVGFTPVVAPVALDAAAASPLNVNADDAAAAIAGSLRGELLLVSDVPGVLIDGIPQSTLGTAELESLIAGGIATAGMAAKLRAAAAALTAGAPSVRIGDLDVLRDPAAGTRILAATPQPA